MWYQCFGFGLGHPYLLLDTVMGQVSGEFLLGYCNYVVIDHQGETELLARQ